MNIKKRNEKNYLECFVILPFAGEYEDIYHFAIEPALAECNYQSVRIDEHDVVPRGPLLYEIIRRIFSSDLVIVDISTLNPNIFYELGIAHTLGKPLITIAREGIQIPFDINAIRVLRYDSAELLRVMLRDWIQKIAQLDGPGTILSPVLDAVPALDQVPRTELTALKTKIEDLQSTLKLREQELESFRNAGEQGVELVALRSEIRSYFTTFTEEVVARHTKDLASAMAEANKLTQENKLLRRYEQEIRRQKEMFLVNPHWAGRNFEIENDLCLLIMPFSEPWSNDAWTLIKSVVESCNMRCRRADEQVGRDIMDDLWEGINKARVVIADLTGKNPNVTYEVGLADVIGKEVILLSQTPNDVPFDFLGLRLITYENSIGGVQTLTKKLRNRLGRLR